MSHLERTDEETAATTSAAPSDAKLLDGRGYQRRNRTIAMHDRDAMGGYKVVAGDRPLTQLAIPQPGAADYFPSTTLTKPAAAQYSIVGKPRAPPSNSNYPGPNQYRTEPNMVWRDRGFPMIGKGKEQETRTCSKGPAAYAVDHGNLATGSTDVGWSLGNRPVFVHGPPNRLVQPVDTHQLTPHEAGPALYRPSSALYHNNIEKSFGLALNQDKEVQHPGPAEYDTRGEGKVRGPAYSLAKRFPHVTSMDNNNPGPGSYDIGTTIGKAQAKSLSSRRKDLSSAHVPAPNTYHIPTAIGRGVATNMTYRAFEKRQADHPGPAEYTVNVRNLSKPPDYSCRKLCIPVYPEIINFGKYDLMLNNEVGPGRYNHKSDASKNDAPSYSMGARSYPNSDESPGPASYRIKNEARPDAQRAPAFPMGTRIETKKVTTGPGPAAYYPTKESGPAKSMSSRHAHGKAQTTPAPNAYQIKSGQTKHGLLKGPQASFKGRPSPYMFSGIRNRIFG